MNTKKILFKLTTVVSEVSSFVGNPVHNNIKYASCFKY